VRKLPIFTLILITCLVSKGLIGQEIVEPVQTFSNYGGRADTIGERVLGLDKSIFFAHRNRKEIILAQREIDLAKERVSEARSFRFPKVDLVFNYSQIDKEETTVLPPNFGSLYLPGTDLGQYYFTRLSLWQNIYAGGRYTSSLKLAESNLSRAKNRLNIVKNNATFEVSKVFYELLAIEEKIKIYEEIIPTIEKYAPQIEELKRRNPDTEKLQINHIITKIKKEYSLLKNNIYPQCRLDFLNTLGLELDIIFMVEGEFTPVTEHYNLSELLAWAFQYRAEPRQIQVEEEMDALSMKLSMSVRYPTVTLGMNYDFGNQDFSSIFNEKVGNISLNFNLPIFDGWASWSRVSQKRIQLEQDRLQRKDMEDSIRLEVRKTHNDYKFWVQGLTRREKELKNYKEMLESIDSGYPATLTETYNKYLDSKMEYIDCICRNLISYAALEHAVGKPLKSE
jgi:hypothetical protein